MARSNARSNRFERSQLDGESLHRRTKCRSLVALVVKANHRPQDADRGGRVPLSRMAAGGHLGAHEIAHKVRRGLNDRAQTESFSSATLGSSRSIGMSSASTPFDASSKHTPWNSCIGAQ